VAGEIWPAEYATARSIKEFFLNEKEHLLLVGRVNESIHTQKKN
jgi:hypothetical protein